jgi:hypothetical protein
MEGILNEVLDVKIVGRQDKRKRILGDRWKQEQEKKRIHTSPIALYIYSYNHCSLRAFSTLSSASISVD